MEFFVREEPNFVLKSSPATTTTSSSTTKSKALTTTLEEKCSAGRQVLFLKTHKTASTTLTNIFLRYAEKHRLLVGLPPERHWELGGYPGKFQAMGKKYIRVFVKTKRA